MWLSALTFSVFFASIATPAEDTAAGAPEASQPRTERGKARRKRMREQAKSAAKGKRKGKARTRPGRRAGSTSMVPLMQSEYARFAFLVQKRRYRQVMSEATKRLAEEPLDPVLHTMRAIAASEFGDYALVPSSVEEGRGSEYLDLMLAVAEADAARFLGAPAQAAELRRQLVVSHERPKREAAMLVRLFGDYRTSGDLQGMWDTAWEVMAIDPESSTSAALLAQYYVAAGDLDEADHWIGLAHHYADLSSNLIQAEVDYQLALGDELAAVSATEDRRRLVGRSRAVTAARAQALAAAEDWDALLVLFDFRYWHLGDEIWHPDFLWPAGLAHAHMGHHTIARDYAQRLRNTFGAYPPAIAGAQAIEEALQD